MDILVLGGTRFFGIHMVTKLLSSGHHVTLATRGQTKDNFGDRVERVIIERSSPQSLSTMLKGKYFDVVCDNICYCSNDVKYLFEAVNFGRYVMTSSLSAYPQLKQNLMESDFDPLKHPLKWCSSTDFTYDEIKRQAESATFQVYSQTPSVAVRFPFVVGEDDYTKRLYFFVEHVVKRIPMNINNLNERMAFIRSDEAGRFLAWIAEQKFTGSFNGCSSGNMSLKEIIDYIERKTQTKSIISLAGETAPFNGVTEYSPNTEKVEGLGFKFSLLEDWIYELLDKYIFVAQK